MQPLDLLGCSLVSAFLLKHIGTALRLPPNYSTIDAGSLHERPVFAVSEFLERVQRSSGLNGQLIMQRDGAVIATPSLYYN